MGRLFLKHHSDATLSQRKGLGMVLMIGKDQRGLDIDVLITEGCSMDVSRPNTFPITCHIPLLTFSADSPRLFH